MRTTKRFTPTVLERFARQGRGEGTYANYQAWHQVTRGDPSSRGRSHITNFRERQFDLLSDKEMHSFLFSSMLPNLDDIRVQFPLSLEENSHELAAYDIRYRSRQPGTLEIAKQLNIRHPICADKGKSKNWKPTTDLLLTLLKADGSRSLLAIACKPDRKPPSKRTRQLLDLERTYWLARSVEWLFITPAEYDESTSNTLRRIQPYCLGEQMSHQYRQLARNIALAFHGMSYNTLVSTLATEIGDTLLAQQALWQAVFYGELPVDLKRGWRPHLPLDLLTRADFSALNPVASRRSAWI